MARTKASVGAKISSGKSSKARCSAAPPPNSSTSAGSTDKTRNASGGNPVCPRETPKWQKPITNFFINKPSNEDNTAGSSKSKPKRNIIYSDDEESDKPINRELDESIELETLNGENSHKIQEYYTNDKGTTSKYKGTGSKDIEPVKESNKENIDSNKRSLDLSDDERIAKKIKIN